MKKYFNKALIYQWFESSKTCIVLALLLWSFISYKMINGNVSQLRSDISYFHNRSLITISIENYVFLGFIFIAIYFMSVGFNKRRNEMFLMSGPYTEKQIKYNELLCICMTLLLFVCVYIYMAVYVYLKNIEVISIAYGYSYFILVEILRIIFIGLIGILSMLIVLSMFNNTFAGIGALLFVLPETFILLFGQLECIISSFKNKNLDNSYSYNEEIVHNSYSPLKYITSQFNISEIDFTYLFYDILILLAIILILYIIYRFVNRPIKNQTGNRIFMSKGIENFMCTCISLEGAFFANLIFFEHNLYRQFIYGNSAQISSILIYNISQLLIVSVLTVIIFIIVKKILKPIK